MTKTPLSELTDEELHQHLDFFKSVPGTPSDPTTDPQTAGTSTVNVGPGGASGRALVAAGEPIGDYSSQEKGIQDLLTGRQEKAAAEAQVGGYLEALPEVLKDSREQFLAGEQQRAEQQFQESVPGLLQTSNVRGTLFSGDTSDLIASSASTIQSGLDVQRQNAEQADLDFYFNAAYSNKMRQWTESGARLSDEPATSHQQAPTSP